MFGAYVKKLTDPHLIALPDHSRLIISYVDDVLICMSTRDMIALEALTKSTWSTLTSEALQIGMSFADNKTKTLHDTIATWGIGTTVQKLRFLGYWLPTPPPFSAELLPPLLFILNTGLPRPTLHLTPSAHCPLDLIGVSVVPPYSAS